MGGCCAPGALGATAVAMQEDGSTYGESKTECEGAEEHQQAHRVLESTGEKPTLLDKRDAVEELLRVVEVEVEKEFIGLTDCSVADGRADHYQYRDNIAGSSRCSSAESPNSVYSAAGSVFSRSSSNKEKSPQLRSPGVREPCTLNKSKVGSTESSGASKRRTTTSFDWAERLESTPESLHRMQREDPISDLNTRHVEDDKIVGNFQKLLLKIFALDTPDKCLQPITTPGPPPEVLTELDDYPRGSSDTNSEEADRDKKSSASVIHTTRTTDPIFHSREISFVSLGTVQIRHRHNLREGSSRTVESYSTADQAREDSSRAHEAFSNSLKTERARDRSIAEDNSYANWLERHSEHLKQNRMDGQTLRECGLNKKDIPSHFKGELQVEPSGCKVVCDQMGESKSNCCTSWTSQDNVNESTDHSRDDDTRSRDQHLVTMQICSDHNGESLTKFESNCMSSWKDPDLSEHISEFYSFRQNEFVKGSFTFNPEMKPIDNSCATLRSMGVQSPCVVPEEISGYQKGWARTELRRSYEAFQTITTVTPPPSPTSGHLLEYGDDKILRDPHARIDTPSSGSSGASRCSKLNSRVGTPKSVLSGSSTLATNVNHREKVKVCVCVRMRPFHDHEKVCPTKQLLCVMGKKVIVKEYDKLAWQRSIDTFETDSMEFKVDFVLDDSFLQKDRKEKQEESQRRTYESIGSPCLEYALDGYNTTIIAYGQVGSGKTHTMFGDGTEEGNGLMPRLGKELMHQLNTDFKGEFEVQVSYLEIYQERIRDLLTPPKVDIQSSRPGTGRNSAAGWFDCSDESVYNESLDCDTSSNSSFCVGTPRSWRPDRIQSVYFNNPIPKKEHLKVREHPVTGPYVEGLQWKSVATWPELETLILQGAANRTLAATPLNKFSSRGHTLFTIKLIRGARRFVDGRHSSSFNLINLVDLAGTERPQCTRRIPLERQDECRYIHRSLAQLNDVILKLSRNKFVSYRGSALTWLLRESLGGNSKLFLIANVSPAEQDFQESVNTLKYASKANRIHSIITTHPDHKRQLLVSMKKEIQVLHDLVQDLTKNKLAECANDELRRARLPAFRLLRCQNAGQLESIDKPS